MNTHFAFEITEDGSHTLFVPSLNEHYHSTHGAVQESQHVYIGAGLNACAKERINVLEIGFGTGLNAFLTMLEAEKTGRNTVYTSLELFPIAPSDAAKLNYADLVAPLQKENFYKLHAAPWETEVAITRRFSLRKHVTDFSNPANFRPANKFDVIFFDAFAPEKQPEMWTQEIFDAIYALCASDAVLTTYCAKGSVRRMLQSAGFTLERLAGPPGKREVLRGIK